MELRPATFACVLALACSVLACSDGGGEGETGSEASGDGATTTGEAGSEAGSETGEDGDTTAGETGTDSDTGGDPSIGPEDYIRADPYPRLVIELDVVEGWAPREELLEHIPVSLGELLDKPGGVELELDELFDPHAEGHQWSFAELDAFAEASSTLAVDDNTIKMHVLFLDGDYVSDDPEAVIFGLAWGRSKVAIFKQTIEEHCQGQVGQGLEERLCAGTERSVLVHEIGHILGLVNLGTPMTTPREDDEHPHHDVNEECVMYWAAERQNAIQKLAQSLVDQDIEYLDFDEACLADILAVREG